MQVEIRGSIVDGEHDLVFTRPWHQPWVLSSLSEHDLRDLEFALAQRRAVSRRCPGTRDEHTCSLAPGHHQVHQCRACVITWPGNTMS